MASYVDIAMTHTHLFDAPLQLDPQSKEACTCSIYGARVSAPTDVPDLTNLIATTSLSMINAAGLPLLPAMFTFDFGDIDLPLVGGDTYWITLEWDGFGDTYAMYDHPSIFYIPLADGSDFDIKTGSDPVTDWTVAPGGFAGLLVINDHTIYNRPYGDSSISVDFGVEASAEYVAESFEMIDVSPCGEFPGEVLVVDDLYVGDGNEPGANSYWAQGEDIRQHEYPCGGVGWLFGTRWTSPWQNYGCFCIGESGQHVPISIFSGYIGCLGLGWGSDPSGPPGLEAMPALTAQGSGYGVGNFTFFPGTWDYWHPDVGSQWVWQGWVKPQNLAIIGAGIRAGWATVDWGYQVTTVGTLDGAINSLDGAQAMPAGTVTVHDTSAFDDSGTIYIESDTPPAPLLDAVSYTGKTATTFTGCNGGIHAHTDGTVVWQPQWSFFQKTWTIIAPWGSVVAEGPQLPVFGWYGSGFDNEETRLVDVQRCFCGPPPDWPPGVEWHCTPNYQFFTKKAPWGFLSFKCLHVYPVVPPPVPAVGVFGMTEPNILPFRDPHVTLDSLV